MKQKNIAAAALALALVAASSVAMAAGPQAKTKPGTWQTSSAFGKQLNGRIIGGISAVGDRSFVVRMKMGTSGLCGGTIIADSWVLTAAHCGQPNTIYAGSNEQSTQTAYTVAQYVKHPSYAGDAYDFALVRINGTFPTNHIRAKLADATVMQAVGKPGDPVTTLGWGNTSTTGSSYPTGLREVTIPVVSDTTCAASYDGSSAANGYTITPALEICAGLAEGGKDSCQGDSGGPLIAPYNGSIYSIGVVSWGLGCAKPKFYGVYAETVAVRDWINSYIGSSTGTVVHNVNLPSVSKGNWSSMYTVSIPAGTTKLVVNISGGTGDADLYVRAGAAPTTTSWNCRPYTSGNTETCTINNPVAGTTYYIGVRAYSAYSGVNMKATRSPN